MKINKLSQVVQELTQGLTWDVTFALVDLVLRLVATCTFFTAADTGSILCLEHLSIR